MKDFHDTTLLPFPEWRRSTTTNKRFSKFVDIIQKLYVNIPLLDAMQVPTYAKYLRAILNKGPLPSTEVIKLTEACSETILRSSPIKKKDPGCPTIDCSISSQMFENALCDLGASVSIMPKAIFDKLDYSTLTPTTMCLQLADQSVCYPAGIAENIPVRIHDFFVPVDFVVLDMQEERKIPLILGGGKIIFTINGQEERFAFRPRPKQCKTLKDQEDQDASTSPTVVSNHKE